MALQKRNWLPSTGGARFSVFWSGPRALGSFFAVPLTRPWPRNSSSTPFGPTMRGSRGSTLNRMPFRVCSRPFSFLSIPPPLLFTLLMLRAFLLFAGLFMLLVLFVTRTGGARRAGSAGLWFLNGSIVSTSPLLLNDGNVCYVSGSNVFIRIAEPRRFLFSLLTCLWFGVKC